MFLPEVVPKLSLLAAKFAWGLPKVSTLTAPELGLAFYGTPPPQAYVACATQILLYPC